MSKVVQFQRPEKEKLSLLTYIIRGTPYEFRVFGKTYRVIGSFYKYRKKREFINGYWEQFIQGINDIHPTWEFNNNQTAQQYKALTPLQQFQVQWECSETYVFYGVLKYADFIDTVKKYSSLEETITAPDIPPTDAA